MPAVTGNNFYIDKHDLHFRTGATNVATINYDTSDESISLNVAGTGAINIGDAGGDIFIGDGTTQSDIIFEQNGAIRALTNKTLTLGQTDSNVTIEAQNFSISGTNVGIGTATPSGKLDVNGVAYFEGGTTVGHIQNETDAAIILNDDDYIHSQNAGSYLRRVIGKDSAGAIHIGEPSTSIINEVKFYAGEGALTKYTFHSGTTELVRIGGDGNVGVGTNDPSAMLHVEGTAQIKGAAGWAGVDTQGGAIYMSDVGVGLLGNMGSNYARPLISTSSQTIIVGSNGTSAIRNIKYNAGNGAGTADSEHNFYTSGTNLRMHIAKDGNVGIGVADPDTLLEVAGVIKSSSTSRVQADVYNNSANSANIIYRSSTSTIVGNNADALVVLDGGNVGINTGSPNQTLHVNGKTQLGTNGFSEGGLLINYASLSETKGGASTILGNAVYAGTTNNTFRRTKGDAGNYIALTYNKGITFHTNVTGNTSDDYDINNHEQMRIDTGGNVGIGTDSPTSKLHVKGPINITRTVNTATSNIDMEGNFRFIADNGYRTTFFNNGVERVRFDVNGNVGIGTNSPGEALDVVGFIRMGNATANSTQKIARQVVRAYNTSHNDFMAFMGTANETSNVVSYGGGSADQTCATKLAFYTHTNVSTSTAGTQRMHINSIGKVGIGAATSFSTDHAGMKLQICAEDTSPSLNTTAIDDCSLVISNEDEDYGTVFAVKSNGIGQIQQRRMSAATYYSLELQPFGGNVGVGTESPSDKLQVNGSFSASSKTFNIEHPTQSGKRLIHGCFEGPEHGVYFRGKTQDSGIQAPEYWSGLVDIDSMTVDVTPIGPNQSIYVDRIEDNGDVYVGANTDEPLNYFYIIYGERKDVDKLEVVKDNPPPDTGIA